MTQHPTPVSSPADDRAEMEALLRTFRQAGSEYWAKSDMMTGILAHLRAEKAAAYNLGLEGGYTARDAANEHEAEEARIDAGVALEALSKVHDEIVGYQAEDLLEGSDPPNLDAAVEAIVGAFAVAVAAAEAAALEKAAVKEDALHTHHKNLCHWDLAANHAGAAGRIRGLISPASLSVQAERTEAAREAAARHWTGQVLWAFFGQTAEPGLSTDGVLALIHRALAERDARIREEGRKEEQLRADTLNAAISFTLEGPYQYMPQDAFEWLKYWNEGSPLAMQELVDWAENDNGGPSQPAQGEREPQP